MALTASPSGFVLRYNQNGQSHAAQYTILNNAGTTYATSIGYGDPVILDTDGTIKLAAAGSTTVTNDVLGIFAGCEYLDSTGKPVTSKNWVASSAVQGSSTVIKAFVYTDPNNVFEVQVGSGGSGYVQTAIGAGASYVVGTPNASTGQSTSYLNATLIAATNTAQFRIIGFGADGFYDATNNPFPTVLVQIGLPQFLAPKAVV